MKLKNFKDLNELVNYNLNIPCCVMYRNNDGLQMYILRTDGSYQVFYNGYLTTQTASKQDVLDVINDDIYMELKVLYNRK